MAGLMRPNRATNFRSGKEMLGNSPGARLEAGRDVKIGSGLGLEWFEFQPKLEIPDDSARGAISGRRPDWNSYQ